MANVNRPGIAGIDLKHALKLGDAFDSPVLGPGDQPEYVMNLRCCRENVSGGLYM